MRRINKYILSAAILSAAFLVGCSSNNESETSENKGLNKDNSVNNDKRNDENTEASLEKNTDISPNIKAVFTGIWHREDKDEGNLYVKIREDRYECQSERKINDDYKNIQGVLNDKDGKNIHLIIEDDLEKETFISIKVLGPNEISIEDENGCNIYTKLDSINAAATTLCNLWESRGRLFSDEKNNGLDQFLEISKEELKVIIEK